MHELGNGSYITNRANKLTCLTLNELQISKCPSQTCSKRGSSGKANFKSTACRVITNLVEN